ncbi:penicillin acylase family protein [Sphaerotilus microaerophilus]|nr:penicillin acylase family protein [Sphaerotilus sp. FB-5]
MTLPRLMVQRHPTSAAAIAALLSAALLAACTTPGGAGGLDARSVQIQRSAHGVAHIEAANLESLAYGVAYAHAEDNACQTANQLITVRGERSRWFGAEARGLFGLRPLPNALIDTFVRAHMDDAALARAFVAASADTQALARGYVAGWNRFLRDQASQLPAPCAAQPWLRPMTLADYLRLNELSMVQAGVAALADAVVAAQPPQAGAALPAPVSLADATAALREEVVLDPPIGSNGWAFGAEVTRNGAGVLLGNPHFPWYGINRFWQMHLTIPGELDVMGAAIGHGGLVQIGFNRDVAWTHTVSTGKRFTLHELKLAPGNPRAYLVDGQSEAMTPRTVRYEVRAADGSLSTREHTVWVTRWGPVLVMPRAGLNWTATQAYAIQDANTLNMRYGDSWLAFNRAKNLADLRAGLAKLGIPWVNTVAADRHGDAMVADVSVVPDVDAAQLERCAPSKPAAALFRAAGLPVLDGSRSDCSWRRDPTSPVPGLTPIERMPIVQRRDWVQNSNDSFWLSNPATPLAGISPMVGPVGTPQRLRTRAGILEIGERLAARDGIAPDGKVGPAEVQAMLFLNRNHAARIVLDDLLAGCANGSAGPLSDASRDGCAALKGWDRRNNPESRGAHLFREWWRQAKDIAGVWRVPFNPADAVRTPAGLKLDDAAVRAKVFEALDKAVATVRAAGFALDAPLAQVQFKRMNAANGGGNVPVHGGDEFEGVLNKVETQGVPTLPKSGYDVNYGSSYLQTVTFDARGPVAQAILAYGQASQPDSPFAFDQLKTFAAKQWPTLPFHAEDVARQRVGAVKRLVRD